MIRLEKLVVPFGSLMLLLLTALAAWTMQPYLLAIPLTVAAFIYMLQRPVMHFYLLLVCIPWSIEYGFSSGLSTDLPDEPFMLLLSFVTLLYLLQNRQFLWAQRGIHFLLLLLLVQYAWTAFSVVGSTHVVLSLKYFLAKGWYLLAFVIAPLLFWKNDVVFRRSAVLLFGSMLLVTMVTMIRHAAMGFTFSSINPALAPFFRNHVNYSALLVCIIPLQVLLLQQAKTKTAKRLLWFSFFITLPALYFSYARGAWLALLTGGVSFWLLRKKWLFQSFLLVMTFVIAAVFWLRHNNRYVEFAHDYRTTIFHENFQEHLRATYEFKDMSTAERFYRWIAGVRMVEDNWQSGLGPTTFYQHYKSYTVPAFKTWVSKNEEQSTVHNYYLLLAIEQGALGLLLFLLLMGALFWYAQRIYHRTSFGFWKSVTATIAVILVMQCTLNFLSDLVETDKVGSIFYLSIAALIIADKKLDNRFVKCPIR